MILDGHIHITDTKIESQGLMENFKKSGVDGGILLSIPPEDYFKDFGTYNGVNLSNETRLQNLMKWAQASPQLYPFYWIDPLEEDALEQVQLAQKYGVDGFKVICNRFYPWDPRALEVFRSIAEINKPILFHSGILWDATASSRYNHPAEFEALLQVRGIRFALAHVSWPWHDECIAVYGKIRNACYTNPKLGIEMFIDITPGTPRIYREEVLNKLFNVGYNVKNNIIFGTDCEANSYNVKVSKNYIDLDEQIFGKLSISKGTKDNVFAKNLLRFVGRDI